MKQKLLIAVMSILFCSGAFAQETWFDANFGSEEWLEAFADTLKNAGMDPYDLRTMEQTAPGQVISIDLGAKRVVKDFVFDGGWFKDTLAYDDNGTELRYCIRLRNNKPSYIEFPEVANAGKISVYVRNASALDDRLLNLQTQDAEGNWLNDSPLNTWTVRGHFYTDNGYDVLTYDVNSAEPIKLRLRRHNNGFMQIFRVVLEKYGSNAVPSTLEGKADVYVVDNTLFLSGAVENASVNIYDFLGKQVFRGVALSNEMPLQMLEAGVYVLKLKTTEGELNRKIVIR